MARRIVFRPEAEDDVLEVRQWYESRRPGLGKAFGQAVDALMTRIVANPFLVQRAHLETRRAVLSDFPYAIYFRPTDDEIVVLAVHGRQGPSRWRTRA